MSEETEKKIMEKDIREVAEKIVEWQNTNPTLIFSVQGIENIIRKVLAKPQAPPVPSENQSPPQVQRSYRINDHT